MPQLRTLSALLFVCSHGPGISVQGTTAICAANSDCATSQTCCNWNNNQGVQQGTGVCADFCATGAFTESPSADQFDWGDGCGGGSGQPFQVTLAEGATASVGLIPKGKWSVKIFLSSSTDVDVQLYDVDASEEPLIAWCETRPKSRSGQIANMCGLLPSNPSMAGQEMVTHNGLKIGYSGYSGTGGQPGKEWITLQGETGTTLLMKAFAFEAGVANVTYEWGRVQTPCCLGIGPCGGSFTSSVDKDAYVDIGKIPSGKRDLSVRLTADEDVDIQLYDVGVVDPTYAPDGVAIIAYADCGDLAQGETCMAGGNCGTLGVGAVCNAGPLGNNAGTPESTIYRSRTYKYSGYYGDGSNYGNEHVTIEGVLNTDLSMRAYGYAAGTFEVGYEYYEDVPDAERPTANAIFWGVAESNRQQQRVVGLFEEALTEASYIIRRGGSFSVTVLTPNSTNATVDCTMSGTVDGQPQPYPASGALTFASTRAGAVIAITATLAHRAPIGE